MDNDPVFIAQAHLVSEELFRVLSNEPPTRGSGALTAHPLPDSTR